MEYDSTGSQPIPEVVGALCALPHLVDDEESAVACEQQTSASDGQGAGPGGA